MNILDDRLAHSNSAVVMAAIKLFLHLTLAMPATHQQVCCLLQLAWQWAAPTSGSGHATDALRATILEPSLLRCWAQHG